MRMSDLIEDCEDYLEFGVDADLDEAMRGFDRIGDVRKKERARKQRVMAGRALTQADRDPTLKCPEGFRRNAKGKCQSAHSLERESSEKSAKAIKQYKSMPMGGGEKKPSLVDRMKAMFGKK
jgi:hypothetical protein